MTTSFIKHPSTIGTSKVNPTHFVLENLTSWCYYRQQQTPQVFQITNIFYFFILGLLFHSPPASLVWYSGHQWSKLTSAVFWTQALCFYSFQHFFWETLVLYHRFLTNGSKILKRAQHSLVWTPWESGSEHKQQELADNWMDTVIKTLWDVWHGQGPGQ